MLQGLKSKKLIVMLIAAVAVIVNRLVGEPLDKETIYSVLGILGTYIIGQGVADHGSQGAAKAAERAIGQGVDVASAVQGVLGARAGNEKPFVHDDEDEGPNWEDTSEVDEEDKPKELLG